MQDVNFSSIRFNNTIFEALHPGSIHYMVVRAWLKDNVLGGWIPLTEHADYSWIITGIRFDDPGDALMFKMKYDFNLWP